MGNPLMLPNPKMDNKTTKETFAFLVFPRNSKEKGANLGCYNGGDTLEKGERGNTTFQERPFIRCRYLSKIHINNIQDEVKHRRIRRRFSVYV